MSHDVAEMWIEILDAAARKVDFKFKKKKDYILLFNFLKSAKSFLKENLLYFDAAI